MLEVLGRGYVIEHCVSSLKLKNEEKAYRTYVTDTLMAIAENTTHFLGMNGVVDYGKTVKTRWIDILNPPPKEDKSEDNRPADEIVSDIWSRIRGTKTQQNK
jgi:hypothetical protein